MKTALPVVHAEIRIPFIIDGGTEIRLYEAVGFKKAGEGPVDGEDMLDRVGAENNGVIGGEDERFIMEHLFDNLRKLPTSFYRFLLVVGRRLPDGRRGASIIVLDRNNGWTRDYGSLEGRYDADVLVVRRLP